MGEKYDCPHGIYRPTCRLCQAERDRRLNRPTKEERIRDLEGEIARIDYRIKIGSDEVKALRRIVPGLKKQLRELKKKK